MTPTPSNLLRPNRPNAALDRTDLELLGLLAKDGRRTNKELAAAVGLAPSSCHTRVQRLLADGVIAGVHAEVCLRPLGLGLQAMISVRLVQQTARLDELSQRLIERPEVLQLYHVSGSEDLLLHVAVEDTDHLGTLLKDDLFLAEEVHHVETSVIFEHRRSHDLPVGS